MRAAGVEYRGLAALRGPLAFVEGTGGAAWQEEVELRGADGLLRAGRVLSASRDAAVIEVLGSTSGLKLGDTTVRLLGAPLRLGVGKELLGRVLDGLGRPRDGLPPPIAGELRRIEGAPLNPTRREYPREFLETGISAIDAMTSVALGQKIPLFTESGLPHDDLLRQIIRQARAPGVESFAIVFAALGLPREVAQQFEEDFRKSGALHRTVAFLALADDPPAERLIAPRCALTCAEHLAFDLGMHVLVVLHDITAYGEALREASAARGEPPGRKGYPGYLYSDLASLFERAGRIKGRPGSITQLPVVTLPGGDMTHPIPDLTGYVTEGQIVLERDLHRRGVYPPIQVLPSLSRLMEDAIGEGRTRADHSALSRQLYACAARAARARALESIIGRDELSEGERRALDFGRAFEDELVRQARDEARPIARTLDLGWQALRHLPDEELSRIPKPLLAKRPKATP